MTSREHVILLHGVWMRGFSLFLLRKRLESAGYSSELFDYASLFGSIESTVARLLARMRRTSAPQVHLVGHSLGGLIALHATRGRSVEVPAGKIVCLGSPLNGSLVARRLAGYRGGKLALGHSLALLRDGLDTWDGSRPVGVIAGTLSRGMGRLMSDLPTPNDGTVGAIETRLPGVSNFCEVHQSHTGLLWSTVTAGRVVEFLRDARFSADGTPGSPKIPS